MRPAAGEVLHFSEDPSIEVFRPHVAATAHQSQAYVWAVDATRAPDYWFPRDCPRAMVWVTPDTTDEDRHRVLGATTANRVHVIEYGWLEVMRSCVLYAYRLPAQVFRPFGEPAPHAQVAEVAVEPLGPPEPVGDLLALHGEAGIELRIVGNLWQFWDAAITSTLGFSGIRLANARARSLT